MNATEPVVDGRAQALRTAMLLVQRVRQQMEAAHAHFAICCGIGMALVIFGTLFGGKGVALGSMGVLVAAVSVTAIRKPFSSIAILFIYIAMEGMYKYLTNFSKVVYVARPMMLAILTGCWLFGYHRRQAVEPDSFGK